MSYMIHAKGRQLRPLTELRDMVEDVSNGLEALCELLRKADSESLAAVSVWTLLEPMKNKLIDASGDLHDMRL